MPTFVAKQEFTCIICGKRVQGINKFNTFVPISSYWVGNNPQETLCSPECSLKHYENVKNNIKT